MILFENCFLPHHSKTRTDRMAFQHGASTAFGGWSNPTRNGCHLLSPGRGMVCLNFTKGGLRRRLLKIEFEKGQEKAGGGGGRTNIEGSRRDLKGGLRRGS